MQVNPINTQIQRQILQDQKMKKSRLDREYQEEIKSGEIARKEEEKELRLSDAHRVEERNLEAAEKHRALRKANTKRIGKNINLRV